MLWHVPFTLLTFCLNLVILTWISWFWHLIRSYDIDIRGFIHFRQGMPSDNSEGLFKISLLEIYVNPTPKNKYILDLFIYCERGVSKLTNCSHLIWFPVQYLWKDIAYYWEPDRSMCYIIWKVEVELTFDSKQVTFYRILQFLLELL